MREYYGEVTSLELLNRLVAAPLPAGLRAGPVQTLFHRDAYFDAADWTLRRRGVTCRFRTRMDDRRLLTLQVPPGPGSADGPREVFEAEVVELDGAETLVVLRQNIDTSAMQASEQRGRRVRLAWRAEDARLLETKEQEAGNT